jgi:hypothetical protein
MIPEGRSGKLGCGRAGKKPAKGERGASEKTSNRRARSGREAGQGEWEGWREQTLRGKSGERGGKALSGRKSHIMVRVRFGRFFHAEG